MNVANQYNVGLYLRLSLEDADNSSNRKGGNPFKTESTSIENQREILMEYVNLNGWNVRKTYVDDGFSGGSFNRPAFQEMLQDSKNGFINLILVKDLSRFGRDHVEVDSYVEDIFPALGVRFIALMDAIDSDGNADILPFRSIMNDYFLKDHSRKIKSVFVEKAKAGNFIGRFAPYGYAKDPERHGRLTIEPTAAGVVRRIFELRQQGYGYAKITGILNTNGILSPKSFFFNKNKIVIDIPYVWRESQISRILKNEVYLGHSVRMKYGHLSYKNKKRVKRHKDEWIRVENTHEPIVSQALWDSANAVYLSKTTKNSKQNDELNLFSGILFCENGHSMGSGTDNQVQKGKLFKYNHYFCSLYKQSGRSVCSWHRISELMLLKIIREDMKTQLEFANADENRIAFEIQKRLEKSSLETIKKEHQRISLKLNKLDEHSAELYERRLTGIISLDDFIIQSAETEKERVEIQAVYDRLSDTIIIAEQNKHNINQWLSRIRFFLSMEKPNRNTLHEIIEKIIIGERKGNKTGPERQQDIKIIYRITGHTV